jgi:hypothetical protein
MPLHALPGHASEERALPDAEFPVRDVNGTFEDLETVVEGLQAALTSTREGNPRP